MNGMLGSTYTEHCTSSTDIQAEHGYNGTVVAECVNSRQATVGCSAVSVLSSLSQMRIQSSNRQQECCLQCALHISKPIRYSINELTFVSRQRTITLQPSLNLLVASEIF